MSDYPLSSFQYGHRIYTPVPDPVIAEVLSVLARAMKNDPAAAGAWGALLAYSLPGEQK
jgi:hypothetical protein